MRVAAVDLDLVRVAVAAAGDDPHVRPSARARSRPANSSGSSVSANAGHRVGGVGGAVEEAQQLARSEAVAAVERDRAALGAAQDRSGEVELGGQLGAAGDHELRRQLDPVHVAVDQLLELGGHLRR